MPVVASLIDKFDPTSIIRLEDRELGLFHDLRQGNYSFSLSTGQNNQSRFFIHVSYPVQIFDTPAGCQNNDGVFQFQQDTTVKWSQCLLYDASSTLVASLNNITGNFSFGNLAEGNYLIAFVYGAYVATISRSLEGNAIELNAMALPVSAAINQTISFYTTGRNIDDYLWQFGDGSTITGIANPEYAYEEAGTYTITVTATNNYGCQLSNTFTITVAEPLSITDTPSQELSLAVLDHRLYLSGVNGYDYTICRLNGQTVSNGRWNEAAPVLLSEYPTGIYVVAVSGPSFHAASSIYLR